MTRLSVLGSTGSIGTQTLDVVRRNPDAFSVEALSCYSNLDLLIQQVREFRPKFVAVRDDASRCKMLESCPDLEIVVGEAGIDQLAVMPEADVIVAAIVGFAALRPVIAALKAGKKVALANKECLVTGGEIVTGLLASGRGRVVPVDSEHSSIYQLLHGLDASKVERIIITASGGPFLRTPLSDLAEVTPAQAVKHPRWAMGAKISVDSATLMNKGLEVIEAGVIFGLPESKVGVLVHPQSIVHGLIEFHDGAVEASLYQPDMRLPISYALGQLAAPPQRTAQNGIARLLLGNIGKLEFEEVDDQRFPALELCRQAFRAGSGACTVLNGANEVAVHAFLAGRIKYFDIISVVRSALSQLDLPKLTSLDSIFEADGMSRACAEEEIRARSR